MGKGEPPAALMRLCECLHQHGVEPSGVRDWPKGPVLSVTVNLAIRHSDNRYRWHEGLADRDHPDHDPDGAAERIAALYRRLQGPSFTTPDESCGESTGSAESLNCEDPQC